MKSDPTIHLPPGALPAPPEPGPVLRQGPIRAMAANRWLFWAGVLALVTGFLLQTVIGASFNPYTGISYDQSFGLVFFAVFLFLMSVVFGGGVIPGNASRGAGPAHWIAVERWTFWAGMLALVAGFLIQVLGGPTFSLTVAAANNEGYLADLVGFAFFIVSALLGGGRLPEASPGGGTSSG
jgi:hypothetical protein